MVVVDNARKMISKTIDIAVTSVLQTTAGKMIFGRFDDRIHAVHSVVHSALPAKDHVAHEKDRPLREQVPVSGTGA